MIRPDSQCPSRTLEVERPICCGPLFCHFSQCVEFEVSIVIFCVLLHKRGCSISLLCFLLRRFKTFLAPFRSRPHVLHRAFSASQCPLDFPTTLRSPARSRCTPRTAFGIDLMTSAIVISPTASVSWSSLKATFLLEPTSLSKVHDPQHCSDGLTLKHL